VTQSNASRDVLLAAGVPESKVKVIPVGIDAADRKEIFPAQIEAAREMLGFPAHAKVFLYLGAVRRIRGIYALLDAFPTVARRNEHACLGIMARGADGKLCETVRSYGVRLGIGDRIKVVGGWLTRDQVLASIDASDVVTLPFVLVPSDVPIAILEALARGKPVIGSNVDGIPELLEGRGTVVDPLNIKAMAEAMLAFVESETYRTDMGDAARAFMADYPNWDHVGEQAWAMGA
jgi:glycosyltransferase involved in cell wall biosynthesis